MDCIAMVMVNNLHDMGHDFTDKVAIVTGGASGIGREVALEFSRNGAAVVVADIQEEAGEAVVDEIEGDGGDATFVHGDVTDMTQMQSMVDTAVEEFGGLDFAFNNAGIGGEQKPTADLEEDEWLAVIDINLNGVWRGMKAELPVMVEHGGGVIVNTASILGQVGFASAAAYTSAKHGVLGLTKVAALDYAEQGVRVNAVCPGFIDTPMLEAGGITDDEEMLTQVKALHAMNRLGTVDEIASGVMWLCSPGASFTTGEYLTIDGGYTSR